MTQKVISMYQEEDKAQVKRRQADTAIQLAMANRWEEAVTVNRWPHGYGFGLDPTTDEVAWTPDWPVGERPWLRARQPFGRIAIANCDAANNAMTEASFSEAHRAVREVLGDR